MVAWTGQFDIRQRKLIISFMVEFQLMTMVWVGDQTMHYVKIITDTNNI